MYKLLAHLLFTLIVGLGPTLETASAIISDQTTRLAYPFARRANEVKTHHGVSVPDPYEWLEDQTAKETVEWVEAQRKFSADYFNKLPHCDAVKKRLDEAHR